MKLDVKCVRAVLLEMEKQPLNQAISFGELQARLPQYTADELRYSCFKLHEAKYIHALRVSADNAIVPFFPQLNDITFTGHEFLNNLRNETVFKKVMGIAGEIGSNSLETVTQIASSVLSEIVKSKLGI